MKKMVALMAVVLIMITPITVMAVDAEDPETMTIRWSDRTLFHFTGIANADYTFSSDEQIWIYKEGEDSRMKTYIADPQHSAAPYSDVLKVQEGEVYEVYCLNLPSIRDVFEHENEETALSSYSFNMYVADKTVDKVKVNSIITYDGGKEASYNITYEPDGNTRYYLVGEVVTLNHVDDKGYYSFSGSYSYSLYSEAEIQLTVKEITGSPYLYITLCVVITALVALLIAICGRKPKL